MNGKREMRHGKSALHVIFVKIIFDLHEFRELREVYNIHVPSIFENASSKDRAMRRVSSNFCTLRENKLAKHFIEYKIERDDVVVTVVTATADDDDELIFGWAG